MNGRARHAAVQDVLLPSGCATSDSISPHRSEEAMLDQLFAEPIVQLLMDRDGIDEATTRRLLQHAAAARVARPRLRDEHGSKAVLRMLQQTSRVSLKEIVAISWIKLISTLTKLRENLTHHKAGSVQGGP